MFTTMELNQVEGALMDQLDRLAQQERRMRPGTFESECVIDAIRYTGSALTKVQLEAHGVDDDDMEATVSANQQAMWGVSASLLVADQGMTEGEFRELWGK